MAARVEFHDAELRILAERDPAIIAAVDRLAGMAVNAMKRLCPVSPVYPTYAAPVPMGSSHGRPYRAKGKGVAWPGGEAVPRYRAAGDLPLRPSGYLRTSIRAERLSDGSIAIGPHASYGRFVNDGTRPHIIRSHGPWPLRNRATGQVFGPLVHHPGTRAVHFVERAAFELNGVVIHV